MEQIEFSGKFSGDISGKFSGDISSEISGKFSSKISDLKIVIAGLGLIGGSLARAFRSRLGISDISAINRSSAPIEQAIKEGMIDRGFTDDGNNPLDNDFSNSSLTYISNADMIFICTPVAQTCKYISAFSKIIKKDCILTDVGSTKGDIMKYVEAMDSPPLFIGGHPMAGTEKTGYSAGYAHLFENAYYILTPGPGINERHLETLKQIVEGTGAIPVILDAKEHDMITAGISHVPHVIAAALVNLVHEMDTPSRHKMQMLAAGGFRDITRIASSSPEMWENIISSNKTAITGVIERYIELLKEFLNITIQGKGGSIFDFFKEARDFRNTFATGRSGPIPTAYAILVDVLDKPGVIGEIATLLGSYGINIKNISVSNSREMEAGCLRIQLTDFDSIENATALLGKNNYKVFKED
ncbi:MAG: prephenate dehydrogenase [Clostridiales bacterium]|nr:prephenate dehydrogenase [Clostridiales bacterium]